MEYDEHHRDPLSQYGVHGHHICIASSQAAAELDE